MELQKLEGMKYAELQKLAKVCGVRANMKADRLLKALQDYYSNTDLKKENGNKNLSVPEVNSQPKMVKRKRSVELVKSPRTPVPKRLKILSTPGSKHKSLASPLQRESPAVNRKTPAQVVTPDKSTPGSLQRNHKRRGTYEKKNSINKAVEKVSTKPNKRSQSQGNGRIEVKDTPGQQTVSEGKCNGKKHARSSTFTKDIEDGEKVIEGKATEGDKSAGTSPGIHDMINAMNVDMTEDQMKASLLTALDKRAKDKVPDTEESGEVSEGSQIPRYKGFGTSKQKKPNTPSGKFQSVHEKQFKKMESIDQWMDRKQQRSDALGTSMKKLHYLTQQMRSAVQTAKTYQTPPSLLKKVQGHGTGRSKVSLFQSPSAKPFVPTVTSVTKADFKFLKSPKPVPLSATRKSPRLSGTGRENKPGNVSILQSHKAKSGTTPFRFTGNTSLMNKSHNSTLNSSAAAKPKFDIRASLQRPVTWKTHKGGVKPLGSYNKTTTNQRIRNENRQKVQANRNDKRLDVQMKRRGFLP